ncbi:MAG: CpaF family protein [Peptostreptococcaceae bacterium]|nr:CpaF family protein [Peptostreptococcaceae bacterium]
MDSTINKYRKELETFIDKIRKILGESEDDDVLGVIERELFSSEILHNISANDVNSFLENAYYRVKSKYGIIEPLLKDEEINEIMVNGPNDIFVEKKGKIIELPIAFLSEKELEDMIRIFASDVHREINEVNPIVDARLENGYRVNGVLKNVALNGPILTIRKFNKNSIRMEDLIEYKSITEECAEFLKTIVKARYNIMISGSTSSGKTTFLGALTGYINAEQERVIIIEDSAELKVEMLKNTVHMECKGANSLGKGEVTMAMLIKTSLRMRPDRIIVGEVRGEEIKDMIQAMSTGHSGSMSTGHSGSVLGMLNRLEALYLMNSDIPIMSVKRQIADALEILIHLERDSTGRRKVVEVAELVRLEGNEYILNQLFRETDKGKLNKTNNNLINDNKLRKWR